MYIGGPWQNEIGERNVGRPGYMKEHNVCIYHDEWRSCNEILGKNNVPVLIKVK